MKLLILTEEFGQKIFKKSNDGTRRLKKRKLFEDYFKTVDV